jgi:hypothetical protein
MKLAMNSTNSIYPYRSIKVLALLSVLSFACITYNDSKFDWPMVLLSLAAVLAGSILEKLGYLAVLLSWIYIGSLVFRKKSYRHFPVLVAIGVLWVLVILQAYGMITGLRSEAINRNYWFIGSGVLFLASSALLLFQVLNQSNQYDGKENGKR